ncbi:glycine-rich RNA-binding protein 3, mitochondrial-like isoform X2 [Malania oleifera]|nr:glycine-rich RNA-binding protein 3, mitochondrial-like isoform X2 [Malania oleifera]
MAFFSKVGNILRQTASKKITSEFSGSNPSIFQAIRCMSSSKLFVGGLSYGTDDMSLREAFGKYGEVIEARVIVDRETGRSRGFGFVTFTSTDEASSAIQAVDGQDLHGRRVRVNYAMDRARGGGFGGGGYGGGGGGYGGDGGGYGSGGGYGGGGGGYGGAGGYGGGYNSGNYGGGGGGQFGGGGGDGNFSVAGGGGGNDAYAGGVGANDAYTGGVGANDAYAGGAGDGSSSSFGSGGYNMGSGYSSAEQFGNGEGGDSTSGDFGGAGQEEPSDGNLRDDDEPDDYANRRA